MLQYVPDVSVDDLLTTKKGLLEGQIVVSAFLILSTSINAKFAPLAGGAASIQTTVSKGAAEQLRVVPLEPATS